ncbi:MAG TPA: hypothetical protein VMW58_13150 [Anaerolineae bacterium]|nr:hypothetical protein [Anaerolineae bacterium]
MSITYHVVEVEGQLVGPMEQKGADRLAKRLGPGAKVRPLQSPTARKIQLALVEMSPEEFSKLEAQRKLTAQRKPPEPAK